MTIRITYVRYLFALHQRLLRLKLAAVATIVISFLLPILGALIFPVKNFSVVVRALGRFFKQPKFYAPSTNVDIRFFGVMGSWHLH